MQRRFELPRRRGLCADAIGEAAQRTDRLLQRLAGRGWHVLDHADLRHGVDHVLVGPGGVYAISSCRPEGVGAARVQDGMLWLRQGGDALADRSGAVINRQVLDSARALQKHIRSRTATHPCVHPVVVLWCDFPQAIAGSDRITFVRGRDLLEWLMRRPAELDDARCEEVAATVESICTAGRPSPWQRASRRSAA